MYVSELPWDRASPDCREFVQWKRGENWLSVSPWSKLDHLAIAVLRKLLHPQPSQRLGIPGIRDHRWCTKRYSQSKGYYYPSPKNLPLILCSTWPQHFNQHYLRKVNTFENFLLNVCVVLTGYICSNKNGIPQGILRTTAVG